MHTLSISMEFMDSARHVGHEGACTTVYLLDGALHSSLTRLNQAKHSLYYNMDVDGGDDWQQWLRQQYEWLSPCAA